MERPKKVFCTFGDTRLRKSLKRIKKQALLMSVYDEILINDQSNLSKDFTKKFQDKLNKHTKGFGYWCWKPQIILQTLEKMQDGDLLQYVDAGCHLNVHGKKRLLEYFDMANNSKSGVVLFKAKEKEECEPGEPFYENYEYKFTKGDLFKYFNVVNDIEITHTNQFAGGIWFIKKNRKNIDFIKSWIEVFENNFSLIDDTESVFPNFEGFVDHRHDQSIISILAKIRGVEKVSISELYTEKDWSELIDYPIWTMRDKNFGLIQELKKFIYPFYQYLTKQNANK